MTLPWDRYACPDAPDTDEQVLVIGAGLAGCWFSRLLAERGVCVRLLEGRHRVGLGASGNPAGIFKPYVTRQATVAMQFYLLAHAYLLQQLEALGLLTANGFEACGVLQLTQKDYPSSNFYHTLNSLQGAAAAATSLQSASIHFPSSGWLNPALLCQQLVEHPLIDRRTGFDVLNIQRANNRSGKPAWQLSCSHNAAEISRFVVLATGQRLCQFEQTSHLPIAAARGQISRFKLKQVSPRPNCVISGKHYAIPDKDTLLVGATFDRHDDDERVREEDHHSNLAGLARLLPDVAVDKLALEGFAGVRATTPDRLPVVGPLADVEAVASAYASLHHGKALKKYPSLPHLDGLYVLGGFGSRGIVTAPLAAKALVEFLLQDKLADEPGLLTRWAPLFNPARFQIRKLKRRYT